MHISASLLWIVDELDNLFLGLVDMGDPYSCSGTFLARCVAGSDAGAI